MLIEIIIGVNVKDGSAATVKDRRMIHGLGVRINATVVGTTGMVARGPNVTFVMEGRSVPDDAAQTVQGDDADGQGKQWISLVICGHGKGLSGCGGRRLGTLYHALLLVSVPLMHGAIIMMVVMIVETITIIHGVLHLASILFPCSCSGPRVFALALAFALRLTGLSSVLGVGLTGLSLRLGGQEAFAAAAAKSSMIAMAAAGGWGANVMKDEGVFPA